jgi:outer membrane protein W
MTRYFHRVLFALFIVAATLPSSAQSNDVALWIVDAELAQSTVVEEGDAIEFDFEEQTGYGISYNRFWTERFSTELALQKYDALMTFDADFIPTLVAGKMRITTLTAMAQWHFNRDGRFSPYVGAGVAHIGGDFEFGPDIDPDTETIDLESEITGTAAVGANLHLTDHIALTGELKLIPWKARAEGDLGLAEAIDVYPATFAAGMRFRF